MAHSRTPEYGSWKAMQSRCLRRGDRCYRHYGGRGIKVCERWRVSFATFLDDMGLRPTLRHTLDRIDVDGNYEPGNCRWATRKEQWQNMRPQVYRHGGERNGNARLTENDVIDIRTVHAFGGRPTDIAREYGLHRTYIHEILNRSRWSDTP